MARCKSDPSLARVEFENFRFPLGVYPVEPMEPRPGYTVLFEAADGGEDAESGADWEEWPDRYVFDIVVSAERVEPLCRMLFSLLPGRVYPILDVLGQDAYREIDPYISYDLVGIDRFTDDLREFRDLFFEDGMVGFGAMSEEPFLYVFVDEHKIITVRAQPEYKERLEKILHAFDLEEMSEPRGADAAAHEHRGVLLSDSSPDGLRFDEIIEDLKSRWRLLLNVDVEQNLDDEGRELGITPWRLVVRFDPDEVGVGIGDAVGDDPSASSYVEVALAAANLREAEEAAFDVAARVLGEVGADVEPETHQPAVVVSDRLSREQLADLLKAATSRKRGGGAGGGGARAKRVKAGVERGETFSPDPPPGESEPLKAGSIWLARVLS